MVHTSLYAFPGVYEGRTKSTPLLSVESWGGVRACMDNVRRKAAFLP